MPKYIQKASGERELFDVKKFARSLRRAGATPAIVKKLLNEIATAPELETTRDIHDYAFNYLKTISRSLASRYNLKNALYELGPTGFPFEQLVAELFRKQGYKVELDQVIDGRCVSHEIDVVVLSMQEKQHFMVECKFHKQAGIKVDVKVALYIKARFDDIAAVWSKMPGHQLPMFHQAWLVSNTKFTTHAVKYAECEGMRLLGWSYPARDNIAELIDKLGVHPVTCLTTLTHSQKMSLVGQGLILCRDLEQKKYLLRKIGIDDNNIGIVLEEARAACSTEI